VIAKLILLVFVGAPLALVLIAVSLAKRDRKRLLSAVRALGCPACGARLSEDSIRVADELWARHIATLMRQNPGVMFRLVRRLAVVCEACRTRLEFDRDSKLLKPIAVVLSFETVGTDD
jgi:hypothetical protein